jgi:hypothetical protein
MAGTVVRSAARDLVIPLHSIYEQDAVTIATQNPRHSVGDKIQMSDGRVFHYASNGTAGALVAGHVLQNAATVANHWNMVCAVAAIGATRISITPTTASMTKNQYANGYVWVNAGTGLGQCYKIKSHLAITLATAGYLELYDPLVVAIDATSRATVSPSPWSGVIDMPATISGYPVGVAPIAVSQSTATIKYYFWCQTWGPCCVLAGGTQVITTPQMSVGHDAGGVIVEAAHAIPTVGWLMNGLQVTDAEYVGCFLRISQ